MTLKEYLKQRDLTEAWLARQIGVSKQSVNRWTKGETTPPPARIKAIAQALNVSSIKILKMFYKQ